MHLRLTPSHLKLSRKFLEILPAVVSSGTKIVHTITLLDAGSDAILIREGIAHILNL